MKKLRRFYTPEELKNIYAGEHNPHRWPEHTERINLTRAIAQRLIDANRLKTVADLSCGDGSLVLGLENIRAQTMCDIHSHAPIEETVRLLESVDLFICTETIEHLEAPWTVLECVAPKTKYIVLSCPFEEDPAIGNYEHYWSFDASDVANMLMQAGFGALQSNIISGEGWTYTYQIWTGMSTRA